MASHGRNPADVSWSGRTGKPGSNWKIPSCVPTVSGRFSSTHIPTVTGTLNDGRGGKGVGYAARLRVQALGGSVKSDGNKLAIEKADEVVLLFAAATDFRGFAGRQLSDPIGATQSDLDKKEFAVPDCAKCHISSTGPIQVGNKSESKPSR